MRVPSTGRRRLSAAIAVASACAVSALLVHTRDGAPLPAQAAVVRRPSRRSTTTATSPSPTHLQQRLGARWNARLRRYDPGPGASTSMVNGDLLLVHAVAAQRGLGGVLRADARARAIVRFLTGPQIYGERPPAGADPQVTGPGWVNGPGRAGRHPVYDSEVIDGLVHAYVARDALGLAPADVARIRRRGPPRRHEPRLRLAGPAPEPDQLVLRDVRGRRDRQRRAHGARRRHGAPARALPRGRPRPRPRCRQPRPRAALPLPAAQGPADDLQRRLGRVREHRLELLALLRAGAPSRHAPAREARPAARVGAARAQRLLDTQRLHELGQRTRLQPLAPAQEDGPRGAGADRRRGAAGAAAWPRVGDVGEVDARSRPARLRRARRP